MAKKIIGKCDGCFLVDFNNGTCTTFVDPDFQWRDGKTCWGRCESADTLICRLEGIERYNRKNNNQHTARLIRNEIDNWARLLKYEECVR